MIFKVGNKVKFLNETGQGVVVKIISNRIIVVERDEDGFEYDMKPNEIINLDAKEGDKDFQVDEEAIMSYLSEPEVKAKTLQKVKIIHLHHNQPLHNEQA